MTVMEIVWQLEQILYQTYTNGFICGALPAIVLKYVSKLWKNPSVRAEEFALYFYDSGGREIKVLK